MTRSAAPTARRSRISEALPASFFDRETEIVSRELLGAVLWCRSSEGVTAGRIVETEAYLGEHDPACHAAGPGMTERTRPLYGAPGTAYVYFIYGVHWCFNAVTREHGLPSAVLVRALEPVEGVALMRARRPAAKTDRDLTNGPGKLCAALGIGPQHNGVSLQRPPLMITRGTTYRDDAIITGPRIGITKAADWPLRWYVAESEYISVRERAKGQRPGAKGRVRGRS
ncbi:MAG TPA: DNA-3-methyladenine glycosylase [Gemmatimonadaceae bacterium]|nr:DNA-3-methyladenine glycosylase [Gemmatimonadaceae bacterium]